MKPDTKLVDLNPHWVEEDGKRMGLSFDCPEHGVGASGYCRQVVPFTPAMDGSPVKSWQSNGAIWQRTGG